MGGLILGGVTTYHFAGISFLAVIIFFLTDYLGLGVEPVIQFSPAALILITSVNILIPTFTLIMVIKKYEKSYHRLVDNEQSLSQTNQELLWEIEARQEAEILQQYAEERLKQALMESPYPTMLHSENGDLILINHAWLEKTGYAKESLRSFRDCLNLCFRDYADKIEQELELLTGSENKLREGKFNLYSEDGELLNWFIRWVQLPELQDDKLQILTIATDLTGLMDVESALRESEENLSRFSLLTNDGIWNWDLRTDEVKFDPLYYTMAGYEVDEFPHQLEEFRKRVHPDDVEKVFKTAEEYLAGVRNDFRVEFRFKTKEDNWLWILGRGKVVEQDQEGKPLRFIGTHTDISDQKAVEEQLNTYQSKLEEIVEDRTLRLNERISEVERLNAALTNILDDYQIANEKLTSLSTNLTNTYQELDSLTYSVSNDLRNPLVEVISSAEALKTKYGSKLDKKALKTLVNVIEKAQLMDRLITDMLNLSDLGRQKLHPEELEPGSIVEKIIKDYQDQIDERKIEIKIKELPRCLADPDLLEIVFLNLFSNAIKFTQKQKNPAITIGYQPDQSNQRVIYFVKDNGLGFKMEDQEKVFDTFQRLHSRKEFQGTGIGLALAKRIINRHGGEIWAEAKENQGATFYFDLERPREFNHDPAEK
jgi:PAS domain S-box-containing protein